MEAPLLSDDMAREFALAGLYYDKISGAAKCPWCTFNCRYFEEDPLTEHRRYDPSCIYFNDNFPGFDCPGSTMVYGIQGVSHDTMQRHWREQVKDIGAGTTYAEYEAK